MGTVIIRERSKRVGTVGEEGKKTWCSEFHLKEEIEQLSRRSGNGLLRRTNAGEALGREGRRAGCSAKEGVPKGMVGEKSGGRGENLNSCR